MARFDMPLEALRGYRPDVVEPDDFDTFWRDTLAEARAIGTPVLRQPAPSPMRQFAVDDVTFPGFAGDPIRAWFVRPTDASAPLPVVIEFAGYGRGRGLPHERLPWPSAGYAQLIVDTRGQGSQWGTGGETDDPHGAGPAVPGFLTRGIDDPASYYYRRVFTDAARAVDAVRTFAEVDPNLVAVAGNSQGGIIAIAASALSDGLIGAMPTVPILCNVERAIGLTDQEPHSEITRYLSVHRSSAERVFRTLSYFDGVSFARRSSTPALFGIAHLDQIAPPSTAYAAANQWKAACEVVDYPWNGHEAGDGLHWTRQAAWLATLVDEGRQPSATAHPGR